MRIAIVNQKGGAGKSTTATLLAKVFALQGLAVTVIDCDPQGGATDLFECRTEPGLFDLLTGGATLAECSHDSTTAGVTVIPADYRLDQIFVTADPYALEDLAGEISSPVVVYDTPPTLQGLTRSAVIAADRVLVPCELSETALAATRYTVEQVRRLKRTPEVWISGWKDPDTAKGTAGELARRYRDSIGDSIAGELPRSLSAAKLATAQGRWTTKTREQIEQPLLNFYSEGNQ